MITVPASYLLFAFGAVFVVLAIVIFAHLYHGFRFGRHDPMTMGVNTAFVFFAVAIISLTVFFLWPVDWSQEFTISAPLPSGVVPNLDIPGNVSDIPDILPTNE